MKKNLLSKIERLKLSISRNKITAEMLIDITNEIIFKKPNQKIIHSILDISHLNQVSSIINQSNFIEKWIDNLSDLISLSNYHFGYMLSQRAKSYKNQTAFQKLDQNFKKKLTYEKLWSNIKLFSKGISTFENSGSRPVIGLLTDNNFNGAMIDLTCLSFGYKVIPIPLNITSINLSYIIEHAEITHIFVGGKVASSLLDEINKDKCKINIILLDDFTDIMEPHKLGIFFK